MDWETVMTPTSGRAPFDDVFDVVVVGSGHAGYAATMTLRRSGRSVLLVGPRGDLVWESGRAFCPDAGTSDDPEWRELAGAVGQRGGSSGEWLDGALTEVVATDRLVTSGASVLYYAWPVAVERDGEALASLIVATKSGLRRVAGRQWIDATESGELVRLCSPRVLAREPSRTGIHLMLQHPGWSEVPGGRGLRPTAWPSERVLSVEVTHSDPAWRERVLAGLTALADAVGPEVANLSLSHLSIEPLSQYEAAAVGSETGVPNVVSAAPALAASAVTTLADRFMLGVHAVAELGRREAAHVEAKVLSNPLPKIEPLHTLSVDVCVAGTGTGGTLAALAAARAGASVVCTEPLAFVGGIGTGGGIHWYYYGVPGGLQREIDQRTRELMKRFDRGPLGDGPFNPWAKMIALERLLREHHVDLRSGALVFGVEKRDDQVSAAVVATQRGVLRIEARAFVDGTGDGDVCALAGAEFSYGRDRDGMLHAYSQSSGLLRELRGRPRMHFVNFDAGFCDPTDPADLTRARLEGVRQYLIDSYENCTRPTYIAPALGLRQARQIVTEYTLTLDDQIGRKRFDDPIGYTGSNFDHHGTDFEFESDEALFWIWVCRQFYTQAACEISYRMLLPRGIGNVWIASRCLGVSQDAHFATRMQRDIQRVGEAAGFAAAEFAMSTGGPASSPYPAVRRWLEKTGTFDKQPRNLNTDFGEPAAAGVSDELPSANKALEQLDRGEPGEATWWLYRHQSVVGEAVLDRLRADVTHPMVSWLAAGVVAMWGDSAAEPRLVAAVESLEYGFGGAYPRSSWRDKTLEPRTWDKAVPNWLCAVALLRRCGTEACLPALTRLAASPVHGLDTVATVAITLEQLVRRGALSRETYSRVAGILDLLLAARMVGAVDYAGRPVGWHSERALRGRDDEMADVPVALAPGLTVRAQLPNTYVDATWQLHLSVASARCAIGLPVHDVAAKYECDERAYVRRAFRGLGRSQGTLGTP